MASPHSGGGGAGGGVEPGWFTHEPKHAWEFKNNILSGITLLQWLPLVWYRRRDIEWSRFWQRVLVLTLMAAVNSVLAVAEWVLWGATVRAAEVNDRPVFVLGHPRTGTTLLHSLLALDSDRFAYCSTFQCGFPSGCLLLGRLKWLFAGLVDKKRPMDNMDLSLDTPQEDELAVNVMTAGWGGGLSPYMPLVFMRQEPEFRPYFSFKGGERVGGGGGGDGDGRTAVEVWTEAFMRFLRKVSVTAGGRRLVLKSPVHTARVALLLQLFPRAQFVYVHRDPVEVLLSALNMADKTYWYSCLNTPGREHVLEFVLNQFEVVFDEYEADKRAIPEGNFVEVRFANLESDIVGEMRRVYEELGWEGFDDGPRAKIEAYAESTRGYRKNRLADPHPGLLAVVRRRWRRVFEAQGYTLPSDPGPETKESTG